MALFVGLKFADCRPVLLDLEGGITQRRRNCFAGSLRSALDRADRDRSFNAGAIVRRGGRRHLRPPGREREEEEKN